eukprot:gene6936-6601_t
MMVPGSLDVSRGPGGDEAKTSVAIINPMPASNKDSGRGKSPRKSTRRTPRRAEEASPTPNRALLDSPSGKGKEGGRVMPYGKSILPGIMEADAASYPVKAARLAATAAAVA